MTGAGPPPPRRIGKKAQRWLDDIGDHAGKRHEETYLDVGEIEVGPHEGPGSFARAAYQLVKELDEQENEWKYSKGVSGCASVPVAPGHGQSLLCEDVRAAKAAGALLLLRHLVSGRRLGAIRLRR